MRVDAHDAPVVHQAIETCERALAADLRSRSVINVASLA